MVATCGRLSGVLPAWPVTSRLPLRPTLSSGKAPPAASRRRRAGPRQEGSLSRSRSRAAGRSCSTISASGVSQWLLTQPVFRCSTGPPVEPSRNRSVIRAGAPHWGHGMVSDMSIPFLGSDNPAISSGAAAPMLPCQLTCLPQGWGRVGWAGSAAEHTVGVPRITIRRWTASGPSARRRGSAPVPSSA